MTSVGTILPRLHVLRGSLGPALHSEAAPEISTRPWIGILAVLTGAFISSLIGRLSNFGLADIRGAIHAGFDDGAWITTAQTVGQMLICPPAAWLGAVYGPRRVLLVSTLVFAAASFALPFSQNLQTFLVLQFISGLASGTFLPLTIGFVVQNLPPRLVAYGIAAYAMSLELSLNISASLEGWYTEHLSWHWIFWQSIPLALAMAVFVWFGIPRQPVNKALSRKADWFGMASISIGLALIYAALDQGNRVDWLNSGLISGLMLGGLLLIAAFIVHESVAETPLLNLRVAIAGDFPLQLILIGVLRFTLLATAYVIPQYLSTVQGYRALDTGRVLIWIALPQLIIAPIAGFLLRRFDARIMMVTGFSLVGTACWLVASGLTKDWATDDFLPSQIMQALGQSAAMSSVVFFAVLHLKPADALTFGTFVQIARIFGGELGTAFMATWVRVREQIASATINLHLQAGDALVDQRLQSYTAAVSARSAGGAEASGRATALLSNALRTQASVQSYIDGFAIAAGGVCLALLLIALLQPAPPHPAAPPSRRRLPAQRRPAFGSPA